MANTPVARTREAHTKPPRVPLGSADSELPRLVGRVAAGDPAAEGLLVERFSRGLSAYLRRLGCPPELAEDLQIGRAHV